jgi:hypothetical protein
MPVIGTLYLNNCSLMISGLLAQNLCGRSYIDKGADNEQMHEHQDGNFTAGLLHPTSVNVSRGNQQPRNTSMLTGTGAHGCRVAHSLCKAQH